MVKLLQAWEEIIDSFRNIIYLSSYARQVWMGVLSIPRSKLEHKALLSNLFCIQTFSVGSFDRKTMWLPHLFFSKIRKTTASHPMGFLPGSTLDHEYEKGYRIPVCQHQGRCSLSLMWGGAGGERLHRSAHDGCSSGSDSREPQLCCLLSESVCSSRRHKRLLNEQALTQIVGLSPDSWRWGSRGWEIFGSLYILNKLNSSQPFPKLMIGKRLCQHTFTA